MAFGYYYFSMAERLFIYTSHYIFLGEGGLTVVPDEFKISQSTPLSIALYVYNVCTHAH